MKKQRRIFWGCMLGVFVFFSILKALMFYELGMMWQLESSIIGLVSLFGVFGTIRAIDLILDRVYPYERNILARLLIQFAASLGIIFTIRSFIFPYIIQLAPVPITRELYMAVTAAHVLFIATLILTMFGFRFFNKWKETELKKEVLEKEKATVQYDNLKNQLNPHFLFNSLTSLNSLIFENPQLASEFLQQLSRVYRYVLENNDKTVVSLSTEVKFIDNYIQLLIARFDKGLAVNIDLAELALDRKILPVTLQILIENAIKHNEVSQDSTLAIDIYSESDYLVVRNSLQVKNIMDTSNKQGLENLKSLYRVLIEKDMLVEQTQTHFMVKIPLIQ